MKKSDIARSLLNILDDADGHALSEEILQEHCKARLPGLKVADFDDALTLIRAEKYIAPMQGELGDDEPRWLLAERGRVWLASKG